MLEALVDLTQNDPALCCEVVQMWSCKHSAEFPAESGCKSDNLTRYKVDVLEHVLPYI